MIRSRRNRICTARITSAPQPIRRRKRLPRKRCASFANLKKPDSVPNVVNLARQTPATHRLVVRHLDRPGVLAVVLDAIKAEHINVQEMENIVFEGAEAAVARINLDNAPSRADA